jgi:LAO/AO transport system kinase
MLSRYTHSSPPPGFGVATLAMTKTLEDWAGQVRAGDIRAIARAVSAIENRALEAEALLRVLFPYTGHASRVGVTGAPGTGKSTLVDKLAICYRLQKKSVGIIAVDPSSPFSGGAILGDRIRMQGHASDEGIFIRSMATRGYLGGLAQATADATLLLDAAGKDVILIETVGVGQGEIEIVRLADCTIVVLVPGMGDDVQGLKAGLMEIADIFVINKSDREGAEKLEEQIRAILQLVPERDGWRPPIVRTIATETKGVDELVRQIVLFRDHFAKAKDRQGRDLAYWRDWLVRLVERRVVEQVLANKISASEFDAIAAEVAARKKDPYTAVSEILSRSGH